MARGERWATTSNVYLLENALRQQEHLGKMFQEDVVLGEKGDGKENSSS